MPGFRCSPQADRGAGSNRDEGSKLAARERGDDAGCPREKENPYHRTTMLL